MEYCIKYNQYHIINIQVTNKYHYLRFVSIKLCYAFLTTEWATNCLTLKNIIKNKLYELL